MRLPSAVSSLSMLVRIAWGIDRRACLFVLAETVGYLLDMLLPVLVAVGINGVARGEATWVVVAGVGMGAAVGAHMLFMVIGIQARLSLVERVGFWFDHEVARRVSSIDDLELLREPRTQDMLQLLNDGHGTLGSSLGTLVNAVNRVAVPIVALVPTVLIDWRIALLLPLVLPMLLTAERSARRDGAAEDRAAAPGRQVAAMLERVVQPAYAGEIRVYRAEDAVRGQIRAAAQAWRAPMVAAERTNALTSIAATAVYYCGAGLVLTWIIVEASAGRASYGAVAAAVLTATRVEDAMSQVRWAVRGLGSAVRTLGRFQALGVITESSASAPDRRPDKVDTGTHDDVVRLCGVGYSYGDRTVLSGVDLELRPGTLTVVMGDSGAGKSTLMRLLLGLYAPTTGAMEVDGVVLDAAARPAWRRACSAALQDAARLELPISTFVGLGIDGEDPDHADAGAVTQALRRGGADGIADALPTGVDSFLGSSWRDGIDVSGGQWQRLVVSRAYADVAPRLLVLDEPTANLDPLGEEALLARYADHARDGRAATVIVTHRFAPARYADQIAVVHEGRLVETGDHASLVDAGGWYATAHRAAHPRATGAEATAATSADHLDNRRHHVTS